MEEKPVESGLNNTEQKDGATAMTGYKSVGAPQSYTVQQRANRQVENKRGVEKRKRRNSHSRTPLKTKLIVLGIIAVAAVVLFGVIVPLVQPKQQNEYYADSDLEKVVDVSNLSTVEYVYNGIAERKDQRDSVDLRIKYKANVRVSFDMSQIKIQSDRDTKKMTVTLPDPIIQEPELDENAFGYLPESATADMSEIIRLCKEDAANEVQGEAQIKETAYSSLKSIIKTLIEPLMGEYTYEWVLAEEAVQQDANKEAAHEEA